MTTPLRVNKNCVRCGKYVFRIGSFPAKEPKKRSNMYECSNCLRFYSYLSQGVTNPKVILINNEVKPRHEKSDH